MAETEQIYASVDLELSGFDPAKDEIIEIGIVRFTVRNGQSVVLEQWDTLVRPSGDIRGRILGLTGIDETLAAQAPMWDEVSARVRQLLDGAIMVGHGVDMDCKFLDARGVNRGKQIIDTLELAQVFLPTYHSYNLENISHYLGIRQESAHRALSDAQAAYAVLEKLAGVYTALPDSARETIARIAEERRKPWIGFFKAVTLVDTSFLQPAKTSRLNVNANVVLPVPQLGSDTLLCVPPDLPVQIPWNVLSSTIPPWTVAYADRGRVFASAEESGAEPYLGAFETVSQKAVQALLDRTTELSDKEALALLKVLVWLAQGTRHGILAEINWSIIGTEVKRLFVSGYSSHTPAGLAVTDFRSLVDFKDKRSAWIEHIDALCDWLELRSGTQLSWYGGIAAFHHIYNPETAFGDAKRQSAVLAGIAAVDTFFALVLLLLKKELRITTGTVALDNLNPYAMSRISQAAKNLQTRLTGFGFTGATDAPVLKFIESLSLYFTQSTDPGDVRWIEFADTRCAFFRRNASLAKSLSEYRRGLGHLVFQTDVQNSELLDFFHKRLGATTFKRAKVEFPPAPRPRTVLTAEGDSEALEVSRRLAELSEGIIIFPTIELLKEYYDSVYTKLAVKVPVIAVGIHGGANKVLRNFEHSAKTVVLTALPSLRGYSGPLLSLNRVIFAGLPWVDMGHPYVGTVARLYFTDPNQYARLIRLLFFVQAMRVFDFSKILELELILKPEEEPLGVFLLKEGLWT